MQIHTHNLTIYFRGYTRHYSNISKAAVKRFISYHQENPDFYGYGLDGWFEAAF